MEMPKPTDDHARLAAFAGEWVGDEIHFPSPWSPAERRATSRLSARIAVDGMYLLTDYREEREGAVAFRGHGVYGHDRARAKYTMHWFDSMGQSPAETLGEWVGDTLTFENQGARGRSRYVYRHTAPGRYTFAIQSSADGAAWTTLMEAEYRRVAAAPTAGA